MVSSREVKAEALWSDISMTLVICLPGAFVRRNEGLLGEWGKDWRLERCMKKGS